MRQLLTGILVAAMAALAGAQDDSRSIVAGRVAALTRDAVWKQVAAVPMRFTTHHPQGMVRIGSTLFVSSVEVTVPTRRLAPPADGYDRDTGKGIGHLFKIDMQGTLLADLPLGEGSIYHPGGIDFDGRSIWVPVAEYRPNSRSIVYRVDPATMQATEVLRVADHIGGLAFDTDDRTLHGISWGSRRFYRWRVDGRGTVSEAERAAGASEPRRRINSSHYVDYQDCKYAGRHRMLCTGVTEIRQAPGAPPFRLGGIELVDLVDGRPLHQVPVLLWTAGGLDMTHNPAWLEPAPQGLRGYFLPEDDLSTLYVYEVGGELPIR